MKKTITKPDGTTEVVEGTAEEIAEYERKVRQEPIREAPPKKKDILKGKSLQELLEEMQKAAPVIPQFIPYYTLPRMEHSPECLLEKAKYGWWSVVPPRCTCGLITYPDQGYRITYGTGTGQTLKIREVVCNGGWSNGALQ